MITDPWQQKAGMFPGEIQRQAPHAAKSKRGQPLSPREVQICELVAEGHANKEIGARLGLTTGTVKVYLSRAICAKTGCDTRLKLARWWLLHVEIPAQYGDCSKCLLRAIHTEDMSPTEKSEVEV